MAQAEGIMTVEQKMRPSGKLNILAECCQRKRVAHTVYRLSPGVTAMPRRVEHAGTLRLLRGFRLLYRDTALSGIAQ